MGQDKQQDRPDANFILKEHSAWGKGIYGKLFLTCGHLLPKLSYMWSRKALLAMDSLSRHRESPKPVPCALRTSGHRNGGEFHFK